MNKLLVAIILLFVIGWVVYDNKSTVIMDVEKNTPEKPLVATTTLQSKDDLIIVTSPLPAMTVMSPFVIAGKARGYWFFEASFPIELRDMKGNLLETIIAQAQGEWMTTEFVPFTANLIFTKPTSPMPAVLVFKKDNPSGMPENDDSFSIPITIQ
jgi:hypothetical protein